MTVIPLVLPDELNTDMTGSSTLASFTPSPLLNLHNFLGVEGGGVISSDLLSWSGWEKVLWLPSRSKNQYEGYARC